MTGGRHAEKYVYCLIVCMVLPACVPVYGLQPEYPEQSKKLTYHYMFPEAYEFVEVETLQPTLRWKSFPRPLNLQRDPEGVLNNITSVTYDLKILQVDERHKVDLVYSRRGLPQPEHTLEQTLQPGTKYLWTVRARFLWEGRVRVSKWGVLGNHRAPRWPIVPNPFYYRFKTPGGEEEMESDGFDEY